jgi:hypothetical protein
MINKNIRKAHEWFKKHENKNITIWHFSGLLNATMNFKAYTIKTSGDMDSISIVAKEGCYTLLGNNEDSYCFTLDKNKMRDDFDAFITSGDTEVGIEIMK